MSTKRDAALRFLSIPGLGGSGPVHWQSEWENKLEQTQRVEQHDWDKPQLAAWLERLDAAIRSSNTPAVLVAHSLGCALVAHWIARNSASLDRVQAALLVAPAELGRCGPVVHTFGPYPQLITAPPVWIVASTNDPYASVPFTRTLCDLWRAKLIDVGPLGHINTQSGHGPWPEGEALLLQLVNATAKDRKEQLPLRPLKQNVG